MAVPARQHLGLLLLMERGRVRVPNPSGENAPEVRAVEMKLICDQEKGSRTF
ncbi:MAG: hypothetical protein WBE21_16720 [Candidatus Acidiferrales bacterium]|jgi:hypothetical protein|nr:hypothetical protein [Candidatus Acidoferrales bacterium]